jgi:single-stranded-DNA-specific exonuclease
MQVRREVWSRLSKETQDFVFDYLSNNLNVKDSEKENFLFPNFEKNLLDGKAMHDMDKAVLRLLLALKNQEKVAVYGDYDCDGIPGTALVRDFFEKIKYPRVVYYIPHRHTEGYGLNKKAIDILADQGVSLILTIDLGTTNIEEIDYANTLQIDTIVTDHHLPIESEDGQILPNAHAILNNKKSFCFYSNKDLCGTGTVYKFILEVLNTLRDIHSRGSREVKKIYDIKTDSCLQNANLSWSDFEKVGLTIPKVGYEKWLLDLVAIATIADMMPLTYENRTLVIYGLHVLSKTNRAGLQTLFKNSKTDIKKVGEQDIAFAVAPRINSASRMAHPKIALSMFSQNLEEGINAAHELEDLNNERKETTKSVTKKIFKILDARIKNSGTKSLPEIVVIGSHDWNPGILGILATKILEKYGVSVFVWGGGDSTSDLEFSNITQPEDSQTLTLDTTLQNLCTFFRGSCRSRGDVHLVRLMTKIKEKFVHFGGHELAGGFSISFENIHTLEQELNNNIESARIENSAELKKLEQEKKVIEISLEKINTDLFEGLKLIGPFGVGNPKPVFKIKNIFETKNERFGKNLEHFKLRLFGKSLSGERLEIEAIKYYVDEALEKRILLSLAERNLHFEIESGWNSNKPRLKINL